MNDEFFKPDEPVKDVVRAFEAGEKFVTADPNVLSTEAVGEVRRQILDAVAEVDRQWCANIESAGVELDQAAATTIAQLRTELEASALAAEKLFEQRDTAIAEAQVLRERVRVAGSESRRLIAKAEAERDTAIWERDAMRPVVEAAQALVGWWRKMQPDESPSHPMAPLAAAVDAYTTKEASDG